MAVYEAKRGALRVYVIKIEKTGKVIVAGGMKVDQKADIASVKKLIRKIDIKEVEVK